MSRDWRIRPARPGDAAGLQRCMAAAYGIYRQRMNGRRLPPMDADYAEEIRDYPSWVVESNGRIVGGLILAFETNEASIANIAVDPDCQGQGIGGALMRFAEATASERGYARLQLATHVLLTENLALYRHFGYREFERDATRVRLIKSIAAPAE